MATTPRPEIPLRCRMCGTDRPDRLAVEGATQMLSSSTAVVETQPTLRRRRRNRLHAYVRCLACGHEWWSSARQALRRAREADAEATADGAA